jgi:hypothetical protein
MKRSSVLLTLVGVALLTLARGHAKPIAPAEAGSFGHVRKLLGAAGIKSPMGTAAVQGAKQFVAWWPYGQRCKEGGWWNNWNGLCLDTRYGEAEAYCLKNGVGWYSDRCGGANGANLDVLCCRLRSG